MRRSLRPLAALRARPGAGGCQLLQEPGRLQDQVGGQEEGARAAAAFQHLLLLPEGSLFLRGQGLGIWALGLRPSAAVTATLCADPRGGQLLSWRGIFKGRRSWRLQT